MAAETEAVALCNPHISFLCFVKGEIYPRVKRRVISKVVDGWRDNAVFDGQDGSNRFNSACGTQQVAGHGFG